MCSFLELNHLRVTFLSLVLLLAACGGGGNGGDKNEGSNSSSAALDSGSVTLVFTDAENPNFDQINLTISQVWLISEDEKISIFSGEQTIDLLSLRDFSNVFASNDLVPRGFYSKIRLGLSAIKLITLNDDGEVEESIDVPVPANGHVDLKPKHDFFVGPDQPLILQVDIDANKSIHLTSTGNGGYRFRPVVFIDILDKPDIGKLIKLQGSVAYQNLDRSLMVLCHISPMIYDHADNDGKRCVLVRLTEHTAVFNSEANLISFENITRGDPLTLFARIGRFDELITTTLPFDGIDQDLDIREHWALLAEVIELGSHGGFLGLKGKALEDPAEQNTFPLALDTGQGFSEDTVLNVQLSDGGKVFFRSGEITTIDSIEEGMPLLAEGVIFLSNERPDFLRSTIIFLDLELDRYKLSGEISAINHDNHTLEMITGTGDRCLKINDDTQYFVVDDDESKQIEFSGIVLGWIVDSYGKELSGGCFMVETLIAFEEINDRANITEIARLVQEGSPAPSATIQPLGQGAEDTLF